MIPQPFQRILLSSLTIGLAAAGAAVGFRDHRRRLAVHRRVKDTAYYGPRVLID
jgi:hypothetical protein